MEGRKEEGKTKVTKNFSDTILIFDYLRHFPFPSHAPGLHIEFIVTEFAATAGGMTGSSFIQLDSGHDTGTFSLEDTPILGPKWIKLPALTLGFIGLQALWSVEMSYGAWTSELWFHTACSLKSRQPRRICYLWGFQNPTWPSCSSLGRFLVSSFSLSLV